MREHGVWCTHRYIDYLTAKMERAVLKEKRKGEATATLSALELVSSFISVRNNTLDTEATSDRLGRNNSRHVFSEISIFFHDNGFTKEVARVVCDGVRPASGYGEIVGNSDATPGKKNRVAFGRRSCELQDGCSHRPRRTTWYTKYEQSEGEGAEKGRIEEGEWEGWDLEPRSIIPGFPEISEISDGSDTESVLKGKRRRKKKRPKKEKSPKREKGRRKVRQKARLEEDR